MRHATSKRAAPEPGNGTAPMNAFTGGVATTFFTEDIHDFTAAQSHEVQALSFLEKPGLATPLVGIAFTMTTPGGAGVLIDGGDTWMREML